MLPPTTRSPVAAFSISRTRSFLFIEVHGYRRWPKVAPTPKASELLPRDGPETSLTFSNYDYGPQSGRSRANSRAPLLTDSTLPMPTLAETRDYPPNSSRSPVSDSDSHQRQRQLSIPWFRLRYVEHGSPRDEYVGNHRVFLCSDRVSNSQVEIPSYRAHNPVVLQSDSQNRHSISCFPPGCSWCRQRCY